MVHTRSKKIMVSALGVLAILIACTVIVAVVVLWPFRPSPLYRFPFPSESLLTESLAIEFSRRALAADGLASPQMRPVPYRRQGQGEDGTNHYFVVNAKASDRGYVRWATPEANCGVTVEKQGDQVVCQVFREK